MFKRRSIQVSWITGDSTSAVRRRCIPNKFNKSSFSKQKNIQGLQSIASKLREQAWLFPALTRNKYSLNGVNFWNLCLRAGWTVELDANPRVAYGLTAILLRRSLICSFKISKFIGTESDRFLRSRILTFVHSFSIFVLSIVVVKVVNFLLWIAT